MTGLLEQALRRAEALSPEEQDALASQIIETLDDEEAWARQFREDPATSRRFRSMYANLPEDVKLRARRAYQLFQRNPAHPGLSFKKVEGQSDIYSVRVGLGHRALGHMDGEDFSSQSGIHLMVIAGFRQFAGNFSRLGKRRQPMRLDPGGEIATRQSLKVIGPEKLGLMYTVSNPGRQNGNSGQ